MSNALSSPPEEPQKRLILPFMEPVYRIGSKYAWTMVRVITGINLIPHGAKKLFGGIEGTAAFFANAGFEPATLLAWMVASTEFFGGILLIFGLFTRPAAFAVAVFMAVAIEYHFPNGFMWNKGGYEYPLMWLVLALAIFFKGAGSLSLDQKWGREF